MLKSSLTFEPRRWAANEAKLQAAHLFFDWAADVAQTSGKRVFVTMQHDLRQDVFVALVEVGNKTFASKHLTPVAVFKDITNQLFKYYERLNACPIKEQQKEKRSPRKKNSGGRRRTNAAGKRLVPVLQGRRSRTG